MAAGRSAALGGGGRARQASRSSRAPFVLQRELADFYVDYQLNAVLDRPDDAAAVLSALHANIQDAFNEAGVQIMSPHYETDPEEPKLVRPENAG